MASPPQSPSLKSAASLHLGMSTESLPQQKPRSGSVGATRSRPQSVSSPPARTPSLATMARELAQDLQMGRTGTSPTPHISANRFQVEAGELGNPDKTGDLQIGRAVDPSFGISEDDLLLNANYSVYNTYDKYTEGYDTYNDSTYEAGDADHHDRGFKTPLCPSFPAGVIRFRLQDEDETKERYYMIANKDASMDEVARFMSVAWRHRTPKLVLSIISSSQYFVPWSMARFEEDFRDGVMQAANATEMWILTEGLDLGVSKVIGDAAHREMARRKNLVQNPLRIQNILRGERFSRLNILGIVSKGSLIYSDLLTGSQTQAQTVFNSGGLPQEKLYDLNPDHTHFILLDDDPDTDAEGLNSFRLGLETRFTKPVGKPRRCQFSESGIPPAEACGSSVDPSLVSSITTPVVGLLVQGGPPDIDHILWLLKKKIPVVVIQGSGLAADLISFAYKEIEQRSDPEYLDSYIKGELMRRVSEAFPEDFANNDISRNLYRDRIIECVKLNYQDNSSFLTILDSSLYGEPLKDLNKYLLTAIFKSQDQLFGVHWREQMEWDLQLTIDWNRPDLARSEIFDKYNLDSFKVSDRVVHLALLRPNREEFVELFLERGLKIHSYLNHKRLHNLFENPADRDFFVTVCLEGVLGKTVNPNRPICHNFVDDMNCELNRLLYKCTGLRNLVNPFELSMNTLGAYMKDSDVAERRATNTLVLWAALTSRYKLAKLLWKRTEEPMAVALVVSMILHRLGTDWCKKDLDMRHLAKETAAEFGKMAVSMLRLSYKESSMYTFSALSKPLEDFSNRTVVELAKLGGNKYFIAHPCCQKWLTQRWFGNIHIRELDWGGSFKLPDGLKIYLSVFFVLPMFLWISCQPTEDRNTDDAEDDEVQDDAQEMSLLLRVTSMEEKIRRLRKKSGFFMTFENILDRGGSHLPVFKQIYYLWTAPITKFWLNQLLYFLHLMLMSVALLMPGCGVFYLNLVVLAWTATIFIELVRLTIIKKRLYPEVAVTWSIIESLIIFIFMLLMLLLRVLTHFVDYISFMTAKFLMSIYLLFFYFRFMVMSVPVSPTLGPMLVSIIAMTKKDVSDWIRLFFMVLVSGAVTIHAVIYPSYPLSVESLRVAFSRAIFGLFLTKIDDLDGDESCSSLYDDREVKYCTGPRYFNATIQKQLARCPHGSLLNYVIVIPYLFNAKLIFITLLYAMFAVTTAKVYNESVEIWKYQRYGMIVDFEKRLVLPPPFTVLCYIFFILKWLGHSVYQAVARMCGRPSCCGPRDDYRDQGAKISVVKPRQKSDYNYWKECINHYIKEEDAQQLEQKRAKTQSDSLSQLLEQMQQQRQMTRQLYDRIIQLETNFTNSWVLLEEMKHMIKRLDPATQVLNQQPKKLIHIFARQSPYIGTLIRRYPVFDKYVPWEVPYDTYDPSVYTRPVSIFSEEYRIFVDPDVLEILEEQNRRQGLSAEELEELPPLPEFTPMYNMVMSNIIDGIHVELDRTSWISVDSQPLRYKLDTLGIPMNPLGRTGLRGRGKLWRFGPNHRIAAVVTRWRRKYSPLGFPMDHMTVDGKRVLECITLTRSDTGELTLPGGNVYGKSTSYSVMCEEFLTSVFLEEEVEGSLKLDQEDMISFFAQFARMSGTQQYQDTRIDMASSGFSASILYRGYIDDPGNTDNAWREAEVWNFHYDLNDLFDDKIKEREKVWREVTPFMRLYGNQDTIVLEAARIHNAYH